MRDRDLENIFIDYLEMDIGFKIQLVNVITEKGINSKLIHDFLSANIKDVDSVLLGLKSRKLLYKLKHKGVKNN